MNSAQLRTSALNLRNRAETEENQPRAAAWLAEAEQLEAQAALDKATPKPAPAAPAKA
jgi:hypothetical protein